MLLGLDTTTERLHLALVDGECSWTRCLHVELGRSASTALLPGFQALLEEAGATPSDLTGCVACVGPGGFTSLRIGVATAEGLALTGLPTWGFSAFELRACALRCAGQFDATWILLDGQRSEAFAQKWGDEALTPAAKHPLPELAALLGSDPWWAPAGFRPKATAHLSHGAWCLKNEEAATLAGLVALCRAKATLAPEAPLVPFYLRETDAELNFPQASAHLSEALRRGHAR
jgi:tRNA threonylcarbamoyladenosine biosynthesis protein TsaB